jgi:hypothetical protein
VAAQLHFAEHPLPLHLLLQHFEGLIDVVVSDKNLHAVFLLGRAVDRLAAGGARAAGARMNTIQVPRRRRRAKQMPMYRLVPAGGTVLPIGTAGDFGGSPLSGRLSNKLVLGSIDTATLVKDFLSAFTELLTPVKHYPFWVPTLDRHALCMRIVAMCLRLGSTLSVKAPSSPSGKNAGEFSMVHTPRAEIAGDAPAVPKVVHSLECALNGGHLGGLELTWSAGLSEDESHGQTPHP